MRKILLFIIVAFVSVSCFDEFLRQEPEGSVTNLNYWKNEKDVESATYGLHALFRQTFGGVSVRLDRERSLPFDYLSTDWRYLVENDLSRTHKPNAPALSWYYEYKVIAQANLILDNIHRAGLPEDRENFYLGQALVLRAYVYFYILRTWGDAPLLLASEDVGEKSRTAWQTIADAVIVDLKRAAEILPPASELKNSEGQRFTSKQYCSRGTATALLAHVYAWKASLNDEPGLVSEAIKACNEVIHSGEYQLAGSVRELCDVVLKGDSQEGIFELSFFDLDNEQNRSGSSMAGCCQKWPVDPMATPATRRTLLRLKYETAKEMFYGTERWEEYFYKADSMATVSTSVTQGAVYIRKFRHVVTHTDGSQQGKVRAYDQNEILLRLADIILLRAELEVKSGRRESAIEDLNTIRRRAGAPLYSAEEDLATAIQDERDKEMFLEGFSQPFFDAVRTCLFRERLREGFRKLTDQDIRDGALYLPVNTDYFRQNTLAKQTIYWERNGYRI